MPDFNVRSDAVNVEQIMEQIRARIREKRGVDYTDAQIRELASVKLEKFLDPRGIRSDLLDQFRRAQPPFAPPELPNFAFEEQTLFESTRGPLRWIRRLLQPILKLFFNPNPLIQALNIQSKLNASAAEREAKRDAARYTFDQLHYEVMHNLVIETTRLGIEVKNLKMRLESLASRLEFNERRARALESAVVYKPSAHDGTSSDERRDEGRRHEHRRGEGRRQETQPKPQPPPTPAPDVQTVTEPGPAEPTPEARPAAEGPGQRSRRRRRRRGRRGGGTAAAIMGEPQAGSEEPAQDAEDVQDLEQVTEDDPAEPEPAQTIEASPDSRTARPEPFEHTFGAQAHPAETATSDPVHSTSAASTARAAGSGEPETDPPPSSET
jgi:hypothetical protein